MSKTNETTNKILNFLFNKGIFCWRQNVAPIPIQRKGQVIAFRSGGKSGQPDIVGILPPAGKYLGIEVKTGKDKLRETQIGFHSSAKKMGAIIFVVKSFEDFVEQYNNFIDKY